MKIYIVHYAKLVERKKNIIFQLNLLGIPEKDYEFIEKYDRDNLHEDEYKNFFAPEFPNTGKAIFLSHIYIYRDIIKNNYNYALILEDDAILYVNFTSILKSYISQLPSNFDMLFIGDGCNLHIPNNELINGKNVYLKSHIPSIIGGEGATRCTDSYLVSLNCANKIIHYFENISVNNLIHENIDLWLNTPLRDLSCNIYWAEPTIVTQGLMIGIYEKSH
jgi:glycosyl transferase family 25